MAPSADTIQADKGSILSKLPRLSTAVWLILICSIFIIIMVPLVLNYVNALTQQTNLRARLNTLEAQHKDLNLKISQQSSLLTEANKYKREADIVRASYPRVSQNPEVTQTLVSLAWNQDITIVSMSLANNTGKLLGADYPALTYDLLLSGQVAGFQNLVIDIGKRYPSSQFTAVNFSPARIEGELDYATITVRIYCDKE